MDALILTSQQVATANAINATIHGRRFSPRLLNDGSYCINADMLGSAEWPEFQALLLTLPRRNVEDSELPQPSNA